MRISEAQNRAAAEFVNLVADRVGSNRAVHPETAIASAARLAGSLLFRSFDLKEQELEPGTVVLSDEANEEGPQLMALMSAVLQRFAVSLDKEKLKGDGRGEDPHLTVGESLSLLQEDTLRIAKERGLTLKEAAQAAAMATAYLVKDCSGSIGAEVGFNIAVYGYIEGSKTVPPVLAGEH